MVRRQVQRKRDDVILLSIDPKFADQIFSGKKIYEFRKPSLPKDLSYVALLENGYRRIVGGFSVKQIHEREIEDLWQEFGKEISVRDRFLSYFEGWETGLAIEIDEVDKFEEPVPVEDLTNKDKELQVPNQFSFIYLTDRSLRLLAEQGDLLDRYLPNTTLDHWITHESEPNTQKLEFRPMLAEEEPQFRELFSQSPVSSVYDDIDESFIEHILDTYDEGEDPYGYFTKEKRIYTFLVNKEVAGFTVTTWKRGGSVKYGPTFLFDKYRGRGLGPRFRKLVDDELKGKGIRKTYSTTPDTAHRVISYVLKSGYQIEAHMENQYSTDHSELVWGKVLDPGFPPTEIREARDTTKTLSIETDSSEFEKFGNFIIDSMEPWYNEIGSSFVKSVQDAENRDLISDYSKKGKQVYIGHDDGTIKCVTIASLKRGGGIKISPFLTDTLGEGVSTFLKFVEDDLRKLEGARKFYTHVPVLDSELISFFGTHGYQTEGLLREPYREGIDMIFLGKLID